jgi:hypothetical protein
MRRVIIGSAIERDVDFAEVRDQLRLLIEGHLARFLTTEVSQTNILRGSSRLQADQ